MSDLVIGDYTAAITIDGSTHYLLIQPGGSSTAYKKITRNVYLGVSGQPADISTSQNFTNKVLDNTNTLTIKDSLFTLQDNLDTTKQAQFQLSGITTATTRTYTLPNASSTLADIATSQTLTNKTLTAPVINNGSITGTTITTDAVVGQSAATNGTAYGMSITSGAIGSAGLQSNSVTTAKITDGNVTSTKLVEAFFRERFQAITSNSAPTGLTVQSGWSFIQGTAANTGNKAITFPVAFSSAPTVFLCPLGLQSTTTPTAIGDFTTAYSGNNNVLYAMSITTTTFSARYVLDSSATLATNLFAGFSWIAIGTV